MWIFGPGPAPSGRRPASTSPTASSPTIAADERARVDRRRPRRRRWSRPARAMRTGCRPRSRRSRPAVRVSIRLGRPASPMYTSRPAGSTSSSARAGRSASFDGVDDRVERQVGQVVRACQACANPSARANASEASVMPEQVHLGPGRAQEHRGQQADRARAEHQRPGRRAPRRPRPRARSALPPGSTSAPSAASTSSGSGCSERAGTASCSASAPWRPPRIPTSCRSAQTCWWPRRQRRHEPSPSIVSPMTRRPSQTSVHAGADRGHPAGPLVAQPHRVAGVALVQVGHLAGEELDVGAADADPLDVHHHLAGRSDRRCDVLHRRPREVR